MPFLIRFHLCLQSASSRRQGHFIPALLIMALLACLMLGVAPAARAATYSVSTVAQLDAAVGSAQNGDTIQIAAGTYNLDQTLQPRNGVNITGVRQSTTILDGGGKIQIMNLSGGSFYTAVSGLTFRNGFASDQGGGLSNSGSATLTNCTFTGCNALEGGGLFNAEHTGLTVTHCTFTGCNAPEGGGGAFVNEGFAQLTECTLSGNTATYGGGLYNLGRRNDATAILTNCTIAQNSASDAGGIYNNRGGMSLSDCVFTQNTSDGISAFKDDGVSYYSTATLTNCTFAGNSGYAAVYNGDTLDYTNHIVSDQLTLTNDIFYGDSSNHGEVFIDDGGVSISHCDIQGGVPGRAADGGGNFNANPQFVNAAAGNAHLQSGSPCLGAGTANAPIYSPYDRDGTPRPNPPSVGAYQGPTLILVVTNIYASGPGSLAKAATDADAHGGATITFDPDVFGINTQTIALGGTLGVTAPIAIVGPDFLGYGPLVTLNAGGQQDIFSVTSGASLFLASLILQNGSAEYGGAINSSGPLILTGCTLQNDNADYGGGIDSSSAVTLTNCTLSGDTAHIGGGAIDSSGPVTLTNCTFQNDSAGGGGAISSSGSLTLSNCTLSGNSASEGGAIDSSSAVTLTNCTLSGNSASASNGGAISSSGGPVILTNCALTSNTAYRAGGAINNGNNATLTLTECTFSGNSAGRGSGGALFNGQGSTATLTDDILWNDSAFNGSEISETYGGASATFCDIQSGYVGTGNFSADPLFVNNTSAPYDVHLRPGSPCLGAGTTNAPDYQATDLAGNSRPNPPTIGVYEGSPINTQTQIASSLNPVAEGQSVTFTATVTNTDPNRPAPAGSVQFQVNGTNQGGPVLLGANGMAQFKTTPPENISTVSASFSSADVFHANSSASLQQTVNVPTKLQLFSRQNPGYDYGTAFTAVVSNVDPNGPLPYGYVDFYVDGNYEYQAYTNQFGNAEFDDYLGGDLPPGPHMIQAYFYGYDGFLSSSASLIQTTIADVTGVSVGWGKQTAPLTSGAALPWLGINKLVVSLNNPAVLAPGDITLTGKAVASYGPVSLSQSGSVYTVTLAKPITVPDRLTLSIGNSGLDSYSTSFTVLPGDVNGDGAVNASDMTLVKNAIGGAYKQTDDIDGSGTVDAADYNAVRQHVGTKLP